MPADMSAPAERYPAQGRGLVPGESVIHALDGDHLVTGITETASGRWLLVHMAGQPIRPVRPDDPLILVAAPAATRIDREGTGNA